MTGKWKKIWDNKNCNLENIELTKLIELDGFDSGLSGYTEAEWIEMTVDAALKSNLMKGHTILEIGCGSGAFLYCLNSEFNNIVYGLDYSKALIQVAEIAIPNGRFTVSDANTYDYGINFFDRIYSHGVFFYFESYEYALSVLKKSYSSLKKGGCLCLMDINDTSSKTEYIAYRQSAYGNKSEYNKKYEGLSHLFYDKYQLVRDMVDMGYSDVQIFDHKIANGSSKFRFNLLAKKL